MHEISPVLAGTNTTPNQMMVAANFNTGNATASADTAASANASQVDDRRYTKFDRTASNAGTDATFTFSDFLDMVNPLQHIPVVSSAYREAEGETINPVARVAGDMAFGGIFGIASIIASGVGAVSDSVLEQQGGKDRTMSVLASLFGGDDKTSPPTTQLASASGAAQQPTAQGAAQPQVGAPSQVSIASVTQTPSTALLASAKANTKSAVASATAPNSAVAQNDGSKGFPFTNKLPYGGVIPPTATMQDQNMAMALAESSHSMRMGNMIYTNRFMNGPKPLPVASQTASTNSVTADAPAPSPTASPPPVAAQSVPAAAQTDVASAPQKNPIPQALMDDMMMMKALDQYRSLGGATPVPGSSLDVTN